MMAILTLDSRQRPLDRKTALQCSNQRQRGAKLQKRR